jgi:hypothetical protein
MDSSAGYAERSLLLATLAPTTTTRGQELRPVRSNARWGPVIEVFIAYVSEAFSPFRTKSIHEIDLYF